MVGDVQGDESVFISGRSLIAWLKLAELRSQLPIVRLERSV